MTLNTPSRRGLFATILAIALLALPVSAADYQEGINLYKSGKYAEAAAVFQTIVDDAPNYDYGYYMLGVCFLKMKKYDEASANLSKAVDLNGDRFEYHHSLASAHRAKNQTLKAVRVLDGAEGLVTDKTKYAFHSLRGSLHLELKKWAEAIDDLEKAKSVRATPPILDGLGKAYYRMGQNTKAVPLLRQSAQANPGNAGTQLILAQSLLDLAAQSTGEAKDRYYREAMGAASVYQSKKPGDYQAVNLVGRAALGAGDYTAAEASFKQVLELNPSYCFAKVNLSMTYLGMKRWGSAESLAREAAKCDARNPVIYDNLGFALQKQKRLEEAIEAYEKSVALKPSSSVQGRIEVCRRNLAIAAENQQLAAEEAANLAEIEAEKARLAEEERKRKEWEKKRDD